MTKSYGALWLQLVLVAVLVSAAALAGPEASGEAALPMDSGGVVSLTIAGAKATAAPGEAFTVTVTLDIKPKWHLYAHEDSTFYGISLDPPEEHPLQGIEVEYPVGEAAEFFGQTVIILEGRHAVAMTAQVPTTLEPGAYKVPFTLAVQACDHATCLAPAMLPVDVEIEVPLRF